MDKNTLGRDTQLPLGVEKRPFLRRVGIRGYKSIAFCDVALQPLTIFVGRNSSGKSNFLDALSFLRDVVSSGTDEAVRRHGGRKAILPRSGRSSVVSFYVEAVYQERSSNEFCMAEYNIGVRVPVKARPTISFESVGIRSVAQGTIVGYKRLRDHVKWIGEDKTIASLSSADRTTLGIHRESPVLEFYLGFIASGFFNFSPGSIRELHESEPNFLLGQDGWNLATVIRSLDGGTLDRVQAYLRLIVEEIEGFKPIRYGEYETIRFLVRSAVGKALSFDAISMSDGSLRALASLVAAFNVPFNRPSVVGIEEPETALHPAALRALVDALEEASGRNQILLTTHSAEILADRDIHPSQVLIVRNRDGQTQITPVDAASKEIIEKELYSLAELQRQDLLDLDEADLRRQAAIRSGDSEA